MSELWRRCLERLEGELNAEDLHTWLMPLQARDDTHGLKLFAPNPYTLETVRERYLARIETVISQLTGHELTVRLEVGSSSPRDTPSGKVAAAAAPTTAAVRAETVVSEPAAPSFAPNLDPHYTF